MSSMDHGARLGSNTVWMFSARAGTQALTVLFTIILARRLGETGLGEYAFVASVVLLANVFTSFGTDMLLVREIAASGDVSRWPAASLIQLTLSIIFIAFALVAAPAVPNLSRDARLALEIYSFALVPLAAYTVFAAALRGLGRFDTYTALSLAIPAAQVVGVWLFVPPGSSVVPVAVVLLGTQTLAAIVGGILCTFRIDRFWAAWRDPAAAIAPLLRASSRIALLGVLGMLYQRATVYLLTAIVGAATTGLFSAAMRAVEGSKTGHIAFFGALYPALAQGGHRARTSAGPRSLWRLIGFATAAAIALTVLASPLVNLLYGPDFAPAAGALQILAWVLIPYTVSSYQSLALVAMRRERPVAEALLASLAALVALNIVLIPRAGLLGACWATLAAEGLQATMLVLRSGGRTILPDLRTVLYQRELSGLP